MALELLVSAGSCDDVLPDGSMPSHEQVLMHFLLALTLWGNIYLKTGDINPQVVIKIYPYDITPFL